MIDNTITKEKLKSYFSITKEALDMVKGKLDSERLELAEDFLDMASRYYRDAEHFYEKDDYVNAFAALNYAHGWLDTCARIGMFDVHDSELFVVD